MSSVGHLGLLLSVLLLACAKPANREPVSGGGRPTAIPTRSVGGKPTPPEGWWCVGAYCVRSRAACENARWGLLAKSNQATQPDCTHLDVAACYWSWLDDPRYVRQDCWVSSKVCEQMISQWQQAVPGPTAKHVSNCSQEP